MKKQSWFYRLLKKLGLIKSRELTEEELVEMCNRAVIYKDDAMLILDLLPDVDAVEVVRCKDCKYFYHDRADRASCELVCGMVLANENGFCSYGERRAEDD